MATKPLLQREFERDKKRLQTWEQLRDALERAWEVVHQLHPQQYAIPVGKGICEWHTCQQIRAALEASKEKSDGN